MRWTALWAHSARQLLAGDLAAAEQLTAAAAELARERGIPEGLLITFGQLLSIRTEQDRLTELAPALDRQIRHNPRLRLLKVTRGFVDAETGRLTEAGALLEQLAAEDFRFDFDRTRPFNLARCADIALRVGAVHLGRRLYGELLGYRDQFATPAGISSRGSIELNLGRIATMLGRFDTAHEHLTAAAHAHAELRAPLLSARTRLALGELLLVASDGGRDRATALLHEAQALGRRHGSVAIEREAQNLLARADAPSPSAA
jgi:tetratricopeptide (TPR) repeat protein